MGNERLSVRLERLQLLRTKVSSLSMTLAQDRVPPPPVVKAVPKTHLPGPLLGDHLPGQANVTPREARDLFQQTRLRKENLPAQIPTLRGYQRVNTLEDSSTSFPKDPSFEGSHSKAPFQAWMFEGSHSHPPAPPPNRSRPSSLPPSEPNPVHQLFARGHRRTTPTPPSKPPPKGLPTLPKPIPRHIEIPSPQPPKPIPRHIEIPSPQPGEIPPAASRLRSPQIPPRIGSVPRNPVPRNLYTAEKRAPAPPVRTHALPSPPMAPPLTRALSLVKRDDAEIAPPPQPQLFSPTPPNVTSRKSVKMAFEL